MTALAPHLCTFLRDHLTDERGCSMHTCEAYTYSFQLLVLYAAERYRTKASALELEQLDAALIGDFLRHLERVRKNSASTRNARLAAIKAFFRFIEYRLPTCLEQARQINAIAIKKTDVPLVDYLTGKEIQSLLDAPHCQRASGIRDRAMLHLGFAAGLRVSELVGLRTEDLLLRPEASIKIRGKGRRERILPLWKETLKAIQSWTSIRPTTLSTELFLNARGGRMTRSGFEYILAKHAKTAMAYCPSLKEKRISPHVLRHSCAMHTLSATHDIRKVALWLGHTSVQSTEVYLRADPAEKLEALSSMLPPSVSKGRFRVPEKLIDMLTAKQ